MKYLIAVIGLLFVLKPEVGFAEGDRSFICQSVKRTTQIIPHLFPPEKVVGGTTEFSYRDPKSFNVKFSEDLTKATIQYLSQNNLVHHDYPCALDGTLKHLDCRNTIFEWISQISFSHPKNDKIRFVEIYFVKNWLNSDNASHLSAEFGTCVLLKK